jgi:hypothetical protein
VLFLLQEHFALGPLDLTGELLGSRNYGGIGSRSFAFEFQVREGGVLSTMIESSEGLEALVERRSGVLL